MKATSLILEKFLHVFIYGVVCVSICVALIALLSKGENSKPEIGSFDSKTFNEGWMLTQDGTQRTVTLPITINAKDGEMVTLTNTLPGFLSDNMSMLTKSHVQDIYIYINGELRNEYSSEKYIPVMYYLPSSYFVTQINESDAGRTIEIKVRLKTNNVLDEVYFGYGNNVWFDVISQNLPVAVLAIVVLAMGMALTVIAIILRNLPESTYYDTKAALYLGLLMMDVAVWVLGESELKALIYSNPFYTNFFVFNLVEIIVILAAMYFNEVQKNRYRTIYMIVEAGAALQFIVNVILQFTGIREFYVTLVFSHIWTAGGALVVAITLIRDIISKKIKEYFITSIGIFGFVLMGLLELVSFYLWWQKAFGVFACSGLILLMVATVIELLISELKMFKQHTNEQTKTIINTVETIASAIDARDKYTGGHSTRVGKYAGIIAREMAADYDFSEEDISRVTYIGLMHDIGKIGVADSVLNKAGKLTDEEFMLMKKHVDIGYELLESIGSDIEGLLDGVRFHHERFDGKGYPLGLSDTDIPLVARILCIADCYDAMTSNRVYRKRLSDEEVRAELIRCKGTQFDPGITELVVRLIDRGDLKPDTTDGMEITLEGDVPESSKLEYLLQQDLLGNSGDILNPTHVRMLCYVVKLMEKKHTNVEIFLAGSANQGKIADCPELVEAFKQNIKGRDIFIDYTDKLKAIALFDKDEEYIKELRKCLEEAGGFFTDIEKFISRNS